MVPGTCYVNICMNQHLNEEQSCLCSCMGLALHISRASHSDSGANIQATRPGAAALSRNLFKQSQKILSMLCLLFQWFSLCCGTSGIWGQRGQFFPGFIKYFREGFSVRAQMHPTQSSCTENRMRQSLERDGIMEAFRSRWFNKKTLKW